MQVKLAVDAGQNHFGDVSEIELLLVILTQTLEENSCNLTGGHYLPDSVKFKVH